MTRPLATSCVRIVTVEWGLPYNLEC